MKFKTTYLEFRKLSTELAAQLEALRSKESEWEGKLDEMEDYINNLEYESQVDAAEERRDALERDYNDLSEANDALEEMSDQFADAEEKCDEEGNDYYTCEMNFLVLYNLIDDYADISSARRGITKPLKKLKEIRSTLAKWDLE